MLSFSSRDRFRCRRLYAPSGILLANNADADKKVIDCINIFGPMSTNALFQLKPKFD